MPVLHAAPHHEGCPGHRLADGAGFHLPPGMTSGRPQKRVWRRAEHEALHGGGIHQPASFGGRDAERLLREDMLARRQRPHRNVKMRSRDRQIEDEVDVPVVNEAVDVSRAQIELRRATLGGVCVEVCTGDNFDAAKQRRVAHIGERNVAASHNADPEFHTIGLCHRRT
jgi:hypothetical protein